MSESRPQFRPRWNGGPLWWIFGIARHEVADHHRRSYRRVAAPEDPDALPAHGAPLEARSLLREVMVDAACDARAAETMGWLAREAAGERLDELAREVSLPAATARQRVSRMHRWLRKRWLHEALLVAAAGVVVSLVVRSAPQAQPRSIVADPWADSAAAASAALDGTWHIERVEPNASLDPARRALVDAEARTTTVEIDGHGLRTESATHGGEWRLDVGPVVNGAFAIEVVDRGEAVERASATLDATARLIVESREGGGGAGGSCWCGERPIRRRAERVSGALSNSRSTERRRRHRHDGAEHDARRFEADPERDPVAWHVRAIGAVDEDVGGMFQLRRDAANVATACVRELRRHGGDGQDRRDDAAREGRAIRGDLN
jgi:hypothetical protein